VSTVKIKATQQWVVPDFVDANMGFLSETRLRGRRR